MICAEISFCSSKELRTRVVHCVAYAGRKTRGVYLGVGNDLALLRDELFLPKFLAFTGILFIC